MNANANAIRAAARERLNTEFKDYSPPSARELHDSSNTQGFDDLAEWRRLTDIVANTANANARTTRIDSNKYYKCSCVAAPGFLLIHAGSIYGYKTGGETWDIAALLRDYARGHGFGDGFGPGKTGGPKYTVMEIPQVVFNIFVEYGDYQQYKNSNVAVHGGRGHPKATHKWTTKVTLKDGSKRALYKNAGKPGELRIRRMATRAGQTVATYVKPPKK